MAENATTRPSVTTVDTSAMPWLNDVSVRPLGSSVTLDIAVGVLTQLGARVVDGDAAAADVTLVDRIGGPSAGPAAAAQYAQWVRDENPGVWVTASAFGLGTQRADAFASELSLLAAGGILGHSRIGDEWAPTVPPGELGLKLVGYSAAVAALHGLHLRRTTAGGSPVHLDLSAQEAVIATGLTLEMAHALSNCPDEGGSARYGAPSGFFDCADGSIYVLVLEQHQWAAFRSVLAPALDDVETLVHARDRADFVNAQLRVWVEHRTVEECERELQRAGVPCTEVNSLDKLMKRAAGVGRALDLTSADAPPLPAVVSVGAEVSSTRPGSVLQEVRVLDAGHVLAVPLGAAWLGAMGAQITKLEDPQRLDIYRRRGPFADGRPGLNRSAYFNQLNFSKTSRDLTVADGTSDLDLSSFDVVLHNLTPRRARAVGVDLASVLERDQPLLAIASGGFGGTGEWANYRAYGHNIHAFAGLVAATRDARGEVGDMGTPWADPLTSVAIAAWVLAWAFAPEQHRVVGVDISMAELTAYQLATLHGRTLDDVYTAAAGQGDFFVRIGDDVAMTAVSVRDADERRQVEKVLSQPLPEIHTLGQLVTVEPFDLDGVPAPAPALADELLRKGIPAAVVQTAHELAVDPYMRSTGLFQQVESADLGQYEVTGLPWRIEGEPHPKVHAAPERPAEA